MGGEITRLEWYATPNILDGTYDDFRLKICPVTRASLSSTYTDNYEGRTPTTVYASPSLRLNPAGEEWFGLDLQTPFAYDGQSNLLVEVWWEGGSNGNVYTYWGPSTGTRSVFSYLSYGSPYFGYPDTGYPDSFLHYMRLTITAAAVENASWGSVKALYR